MFKTHKTFYESPKNIDYIETAMELLYENFELMV
jgi:hypothetical protein